MDYIKMYMKIMGVIVASLAFAYAFAYLEEEADRTSQVPESCEKKPLQLPTKDRLLESMIESLDRELASIGTDRKTIFERLKKHPILSTARVPECKIFPEHKRHRVLALPPEVEKRIADEYVKKIREKGGFYDDATDFARVSNIVLRIVSVLPEKVNVRIFLQADDSINACCLPDGTVFVNRGTVRELPDEDMLAAVIAHEYGHAVAHHGNENVSRVLKWSLVGGATDAFTEALFESGRKSAGGLLQVAYGLGVHIGSILPGSRRAEYEADRLGMLYMARAGYDPAKMVSLFEFFKQRLGGQSSNGVEYLSTHPNDQGRIDNAQKILPLVVMKK